MRLSATLKIKQQTISCQACGHELGSVEQNWKDKAILNEAPLQTLGQPYTAGNGVLLRSFSCPNCGILLDTETACKDDPFLFDRLFTDHA